MSDERAQNTAAPDAPRAPAYDGSACGVACAAAEVEPISHNGPMACLIGHISPRILPDGHMTVEVWANHVRVKRPRHLFPMKPSVRGKIKGMSARSSRRLRWAIENTPVLLTKDALFICLTYPAEWPRDGREVKRHLDTFGKRVRRVGGCFAWALEYQSRGAPHFHLLGRFPDAWELAEVRRWIASTWFEVVGSGDEKHLAAGTSVEQVNIPEHAGRYISSYLGKEYQKAPPPDVTLPGRMWGMIGCKPPKPEVLRFSEGSRDGINLVRLIRRWASSDHAFRQRERFLPVVERKSLAKSMRLTDPDIASALLDFRNCPVTAEVPSERRKRWSPHDPGREKGFRVCNAAMAVSAFLKLLSHTLPVMP